MFLRNTLHHKNHTHGSRCFVICYGLVAVHAIQGYLTKTEWHDYAEYGLMFDMNPTNTMIYIYIYIQHTANRMHITSVILYIAQLYKHKRQSERQPLSQLIRNNFLVRILVVCFVQGSHHPVMQIFLVTLTISSNCEQIVEFPVIWTNNTPMWRHYNYYPLWQSKC